MRIVDQNGRVFGRVNFIDLTAAITAILVAAAAYGYFSAPHRTAPESLRTVGGAWCEVVLRLTADQGWLVESIEAGQQERDARTGELLAEVQSAERLPDGDVEVRIHCRAIPEQDGHFSVDGKRLVPGERLKIRTEGCVLEGFIRSARPVERAAP